MNSNASASRDSNYNFRIGGKGGDQSQKDPNETTNAPFKRTGTIKPQGDGNARESQMSRRSKEFAEEPYDVDNNIQEESSDEEGQKIYYYKCPVFRVSYTFQI